jgi:uncharacterized lipoprotein YajG
MNDNHSRPVGRVLLGAAALALAALAGCATPRVNLAVTAVPPGQGPAVGVVSVQDQRANKKKLATVRSTVGIPGTYKMDTDKPIEQWLEELAVAEMNSAGFASNRGEPPAGGAGAFTVSANIKTFYCDSYYSYQPQVLIEFLASRAGQNVLTKTYEGKHAASGSFVQSAEGFRDALEKAARNAIKDFVADLKKL